MGANMNKKIIALIMLLSITVLVLSSCGNRQVGFDTAQSFNKAYIKLGDEWQTVTVKAWRDFDNGDEIQIVASDGTVYLTHYSNMILVSGK